MAKSKQTHKPKILRPFMVTLAAMATWAALHQPAQFNPGSIGVWGLSAVTVALLVRAGLALLAPVLDMMGAIFGRAMQTLPHDGAGS